MSQNSFFDLFRKILGWYSGTRRRPAEGSGIFLPFIGMVYSESVRAGFIYQGNILPEDEHEMKK
ncbi:MAG: hypothetical protein Q4C96_00200 [Planctomycetia bacterium]|nr:hypothetical protein [Planctomycetia bacterium]